MTPSRRITGFFNIEPGEERLIGWLVLLYFVLALGFVFVQSMAFGVFLSEYGVQGLPYSYLTIAVVASLVALLYIRLSGRMAFAQLLVVNLVFLGAVSVVIWLALKTPLYHAVAFILPLWFQIVINLANLAVWALAGRLFDFRQGKRLFPLLGAGNWLANIIGGLFVPTLVTAIGPTNLLLLAGVSFGAGLLILRVITRAYLQVEPAARPTARRATRPTPAQAGLFKDRYVLLIFAYTLLWWVAFFFVDNIFYGRAFAQYPDAGQLTAFLGQFISILGIVALISSTVVTSRVIARFGLRAGLLAMPLLVIVSLGLLAVSSSLGASLIFVFGVAAFAKLADVAFGFSLSQSANAIVYQSLPDTTRGRVQATAEGVVQPLAVGVAGISLLALTTGLKLTYIGLAYVFVGVGLAWLFVIFLLSGNYVQALTRAITKRRLGDSAEALADPASVALLRDRLKADQPGVVLYALNKLEALDQAAVIHELPTLLRHPAPEVRCEAFRRVEYLKLREAVPGVQQQLAVETVPGVREAALRALGALATGTPFSELTHALDAPDHAARRGALIGLLKYADDGAARQRLEALLASPDSAERNLALEVVGEIKRPAYYPHLIAACDAPETSRAAGLALAAIGAEALPAITAAFSQPDAPAHRLATLANVLGRLDGAQAHTVLLTRMAGPEGNLRSHVLNALSQSGYRTKDAARIERAVKAEVEQAAWLSAAEVDLGATEPTALLAAALREAVAQHRHRALMLLALVFDADAIRRVREALLVGSATQISYALEIMDTQLPAEWKRWVMPLLEELPAAARQQRWTALFPQAKQTPAERLQALSAGSHFSSWVRLCAQYTAARLAGDGPTGGSAMLSTVEKVLILKTVSMFSRTPDNVLAEVADLLEEVDAAENETIFKQGEAGDSLYIILDGKVRVHDGERLLNYLGEREVFGEMALLDPEPRLASVTAVEATRLFRLDQAPFYELMAERPEVATGIIRVLTGHLRNRVRDVAELKARVEALERGDERHAQPRA